MAIANSSSRPDDVTRPRPGAVPVSRGTPAADVGIDTDVDMLVRYNSRVLDPVSTVVDPSSQRTGRPYLRSTVSIADTLLAAHDVVGKPLVLLDAGIRNLERNVVRGSDPGR